MNNEPKLQLYFMWSCPFCLKVLLAIWPLKWKGKIPAVTLCNIARPQNRQRLIDGGGKKQVPCLSITDSQSNQVIWLYESAEIIQWFKRYAARVKQSI